MKRRFWMGVIVGVLISAVVWIGSDRYQTFRYSNRRLTHLMHPITRDRITLLILGGFGHDVTYLVHDYYQSLEVPDDKNRVELGDELGIAYTDSAWIVYYLGTFTDHRGLNEKSLIFVPLTPESYNDLLKQGKDRFAYRGVF